MKKEPVFQNQSRGYKLSVCGLWKLPERSCQAIYLHHSLDCSGIEDPTLRALIAILMRAYLLVLEKYTPDGAFSTECLQYLSYADKELMLDDELMEELRTEAILG